MLKIIFRFQKVINFYFALLEEVASQSVRCVQDSLGQFKLLKNADVDVLVLIVIQIYFSHRNSVLCISPRFSIRS